MPARIVTYVGDEPMEQYCANCNEEIDFQNDVKIQTCIAGGFHICVLRKHLLIIKPRSLRRGLITQNKHYL
jgi:hypothetical protein